MISSSEQLNEGSLEMRLHVEAMTDYIHGLLTKREVEMAGYWPSSFLVCLWIETSSRSINTQECIQYPAILTEQAWSIKDLLIEIKRQNTISFLCGTKPVSRTGKTAPSFPLW